MKKDFSHKFIYCLLLVIAAGLMFFEFIWNSLDNSPPQKPNDTKSI